MPVMLVVAAALIDPRGRLLVQQRPEGKSMAGLWEFPGGKVEPDETPEVALARELTEELGITVDPAAFSAAAFASEPLGSRHLVLLLYLCREWSGDPQPLEGGALDWVDVGDLATLPMPPADLPLVDLLKRLL